MTTGLSNPRSESLNPFSACDPFAALQRNFDELVRRFRTDWNGNGAHQEVVPSIDLSETDEAVQVRMDVPGIKASEIRVEVSGNTLRVSGEHREEKEQKGRTYHRIERKSGSFARAVTLPVPVKEKEVAAECKEGVLTITLPKCEVAKTHKVHVAAG